MLNKKSYLKTAQRVAQKQRGGIKITDCRDVGGCLTFFVTEEKRGGGKVLQRELSRFFNQEVRLVTVGPRQKAAKIGGLGLCGRPLCCSRWLKEPPEVPAAVLAGSALAQNPTRCTGMCGRLLCCLLFEREEFACPHSQQTPPPPPQKPLQKPKSPKHPAAKRRIRRLKLR